MFRNNDLAEKNGTSATIGIKHWLLYDCIGLLMIIPLIGWLIALGLYLYIGFGNYTAPSMANRVKASLLIALVTIILLIILLVAFGGSFYINLI